MIQKIKKITFVGLSEEKESFVQSLQKAGVTHVEIPRDATTPTEVIRELQRVTDVRKFLSRLQVERRPMESETTDIHVRLCARRDDLAQAETRLQTELSGLKKERIHVEAWGDFNPEDIALLRSKGVDIRFYRVTRIVFDGLSLHNVFFVITRKNKNEIAFVTFTPRSLDCVDQNPTVADMDASRPVRLAQPIDIGLAEEKSPERGLAEIDRLIVQKEAELSKILEEYQRMSAHIATLEQAEKELMDEVEFRKVLLNAGSELEGKLFMLTCWSPLPVEQLTRMIDPQLTYTYFSADPDPADRVPVLLQNKRPFESGEDLVQVYSHPNYSDFDPSGVVLYCFAIFFGMIIGDAGYGSMLLALNLYLHYKIKSTAPIWIRLRRVNYLTAMSTIFFGVISVSYFGIGIPKDHFLSRFLLIDFNSNAGQNLVMLVSIVIGMVHLTLAFTIKLYRNKDLPSLGWILVTWAGFAVIMTHMKTGAVNPLAKWLLISGLLIVVLFSSSHRNFIIRLLIGLNASLGAIQIFADVLSYMRLFALGLATMYMCQTFNMLANMVYEGVPYVGFLLAIFILIFGHGINLLLAVMGGVVHGLRLNFLEWYRWCFEGDGMPFKPFKLVSSRHNS